MTMMKALTRSIKDGKSATTPQATSASMMIIRTADEARDRKEWQVAASHYRQAVEQDDTLQPIWVQLGNMLKEAKAFQQSESAYAKALELKPKDGDAFLQLGHLLKLCGRPREAASAYENALRVDPDNFYAFMELGILSPGSALLKESRAGRMTHPEFMEIREVMNALRAKRVDGFSFFQDPVFKSAPPDRVQ